jgi:hypothetical protein
LLAVRPDDANFRRRDLIIAPYSLRLDDPRLLRTCLQKRHGRSRHRKRLFAVPTIASTYGQWSIEPCTLAGRGIVRRRRR